MRLLFGIKSLSVVRGGAERVLINVCSELVERGHEISIVTFDKPEDSLLYPISSKINLIQLGVGNPRYRTNASDFFNRILALRELSIKIKPDVVVGFMSSIYILFALGLVGLRIPLVSSEHIVPMYYKNRKLEFILMIIAGLLSKKITVLSENVKQMYPKILHKKMVPIANPLGIEKTTYSSNKNFNNKVILNVGRLEDQKDQATLITAFSLISKENPDWTLRIVGEGSLRLSLEQLAVHLSIDHKVFFVGSVENIEYEYSEATFLVVSSKFESFGLVTLEAMSFGLPVIGFRNCAGTNELIINEVNGLLIDESDKVANLSHGMMILIKNYDLYEELKTNTELTVKKFSLKKITSIWEEMLINTHLKD
jgi:glycosyltransferase involved in cell wall biosynthesis